MNNSAWTTHVKKVRAANPSLSYKDALQYASKTYSTGSSSKASSSKAKAQAKARQAKKAVGIVIDDIHKSAFPQ
jgi:hypothetical protein